MALPQSRTDREQQKFEETTAGEVAVRIIGEIDPGGLGIPEHDFIDLDYTGEDLTGVVYKTGGSGGTTVATLALTYSGGLLDTVTKT